MARSFKFLACFCLACTWIITSCTTTSLPGYDIVHIKGVEWASNLTTSYAYFGSSCEPGGTPEVYLPVSDGDLLFMSGENSLELYFRYRKDTSNQLIVTVDTLHPHLGYVNGRLSSLLIGDTLTGDMIMELENSKSLSGRTGIYLGAEVSASLFNDLVTLADPDWLILESLPVGQDQWVDFLPEGLELLWIPGKLSESILLPGCCPNIESLILTDWDPGQEGLLRLSTQEKLHTLTLAGCGFTDLSVIEFPRSLRRLHLVDCDTLTDISAVSGTGHLESLGMAGSHNLVSMEPVSRMKHLKRISFPGNITQEEFTALVKKLPHLKVVELLDCPGVTDLAPLQNKKQLEVLSLQVEDSIPENLGSLTQLDLVILGNEVFEKSPDRITELRSQLPDTRIVPGSGLCLGSGWLLLLLPLVLLSRYLFKRR